MILVRTWLHFKVQNPPKSCHGASWRPLGASWARLGRSLGRLRRSSWGVMEASRAAMGILKALWPVLGRHGEPESRESPGMPGMPGSRSIVQLYHGAMMHPASTFAYSALGVMKTTQLFTLLDLPVSCIFLLVFLESKSS